MFQLLLHNIFWLGLVFSGYPLAKVAKIDYGYNRIETSIFRRLYGPNCSNYVLQDDPKVGLFMADYGNGRHWTISNNFLTNHNQQHNPSCEKILKVNSWYKHSNLNSLKFCNITTGYEIVYADGTSLILDGDICEKKLNEMIESSRTGEYVFYSKSPSKSGYFICKFAYSEKLN